MPSTTKKLLKPKKASAKPKKAIKPKKVVSAKKAVKPKKAAKPKKAIKPKKAVKPKKSVSPKKVIKSKKAVKPKKAVTPPKLEIVPPKPKKKVALKLSDKGKFMNVRQLRYFEEKLLTWRAEISVEFSQTLEDLQQENLNAPDMTDRATSESGRSLELRARDRQRKLVSKIDLALARISTKTYGYCEETGEQISLQRLDARPIATLSLEAQERHERREKVYRDD